MSISKDAEIERLRAALQRARNYVAAAAEFEPGDDEPPSGPEVLAAIDAALATTPAPSARGQLSAALRDVPETVSVGSADSNAVGFDSHRRAADSSGLTCTGTTAFWCPRCGDCGCSRDADGGCDFDTEGCPLHGSTSQHAAPAPAEETASTWEKHAKSELKKARKISRRLDALLAARAPTPSGDETSAAKSEWPGRRSDFVAWIRAWGTDLTKLDDPSVVLVGEALLRVAREVADGRTMPWTSVFSTHVPTRDDSVCSHCDRGVIDVPGPITAEVCPWCKGNYRAPPPAVDEASVERAVARIRAVEWETETIDWPSIAYATVQPELLAAILRVAAEVRRGT